MRLTIATLRRVVKGELTIQFVPQALTSFGGLELLGRYLRQIDLGARLRHAFAGRRSDYGNARIAMVLLALFYVGARRLEHLRYLSGDPLVTRFSGLARLPTRRTVADWLRQFTQETLAPLVALNRDLVTEALARLDLPRLTIDVDGSVIRTGATVGWAFRGFNPHHRKNLSYDPLIADVAETGQILRLKNRPANVHDSKQAVPSCARSSRTCAPVRAARGPGVLDGRCLRPARDSAAPDGPGLWLRDQGRELELASCSRRSPPPAAAGSRSPRRHRPRDRVGHPAVAGPPTPRGAVPKARPPPDAPELPAGPVHAGRWALRVLGRRDEPAAGLVGPLAFACGRGAQEKTFAELEGEFALDVVPTKHYAATSAWQQLSILAHNLIRNFQLADPGRAKAPVPEAHLRLPLPQHADAPASPHRPGGPLDPPRRSERAPPHSQCRDGDPVWADCSPACGLIYSPIGVKCPLGFDT